MFRVLSHVEQDFNVLICLGLGLGRAGSLPCSAMSVVAVAEASGGGGSLDRVTEYLAAYAGLAATRLGRHLEGRCVASEAITTTSANVVSAPVPALW